MSNRKPATVASAFALALALAVAPVPAAAADWTPAEWGDLDTLQFRTECPDEGEHWSYVWLVVLDGDVWVRLGSRAGGRLDCNAGGRRTTIRIDGETFENVELVHVAEMEEKVAAAMAAKYSTDIFVAWMAHPYTMKLVLPKE